MNCKIQDLMKFIENSGEKHHYSITHTNDEKKIAHEVYFKNNKWLCRELGSGNNWDEFNLDSVEYYFNYKNICLDHFNASMIRSIIMQSNYHRLMYSKIEKLLGKDILKESKKQFDEFQKSLTKEIRKLTGPNLSIIDGDKSDEKS